MLKIETSSRLSHNLYRAEQVRENEKAAANQANTSLYGLMQRAGEAVFMHTQALYPDAKVWLVLIGKGNNGGDAYIVAKHALAANFKVLACLAEPEPSPSGDAITARNEFLAAGGEFTDFSEQLIEQADIIIDGLLGTGLSRLLSEPYVSIIESINRASTPTIAIDVPSGLHADTGVPLTKAVTAAVTVTLIGIKQGLTTGLGKQLCGKLILADLGISKQFMQQVKTNTLLLSSHDFNSLTQRATHSHKGHYGRVLCVGGNQGMSGAIRLSAQAALRTGAGLVKVFTHKNSVLPVALALPELMVTSENLKDALSWSSCVVIGPGLGRDKWAEELFSEVLAHCCETNKPTLIDADGLYCLSQMPANVMPVNTILTPHAGEAARLRNITVAEIEADRFGAAASIFKQYRAICVLKGAGSIIHSQRSVVVCQQGNPGMAIAGSGDVLSGVIGGLLAQQLAAPWAASYGVCVHADAGDRVVAHSGQRGMLASDLFPAIRDIVNGRKK